jgi:hypothetical protein
MLIQAPFKKNILSFDSRSRLGTKTGDGGGKRRGGILFKIWGNICPIFGKIFHYFLGKFVLLFGKIFYLFGTGFNICLFFTLCYTNFISQKLTQLSNSLIFKKFFALPTTALFYIIIFLFKMILWPKILKELTRLHSCIMVI